MRRRWLWGTAGVILAAFAACGDDDDDAGGDETGRERSTTTESTTTTTQPPASDIEDVQPYVETLLAEWDAAMTEVLADLEAVAADSAHPARLGLAESFTADSPYVRDIGLLVEGYLSQDVGSIVPAFEGEVQQTTLTELADEPPDDPDQVSFLFCIHTDGQWLSLATGEDMDLDATVTHGTGEARRVDGEWLLHGLRQLGPPTESEGAPDACLDGATRPLRGGKDGEQ